MATHFGLTVTLEIGFTNAALRLDDPSFGILDTNRLNTDYVWTDVSTYCKSFRTDIGRSRNLERFSAGTATFVFDDTTDRRFDPTNTAGAYYPNVRPGIPIRLKATYNAVEYPIWWGFIDAWNPSYIKGSGTGGGTEVEVQATDSFGLLARNRPQVEPQGAGELSGARVSRILNFADWPITASDVGAGTVNLISTTFEDSALDELMATMFSEGGSVYQNQAGTIVFEDRNAIFTNTASVTSQATFGDSGSELRYYDIGLALDDELVKNDVTLETRPGKTIHRTDTSSQGSYGIRSFEVTGLLNQNAGQLQGLADFLIALNPDAEVRFDNLTLRPQAAPTTLWPQALGRNIHDRITVRRRPAGGGAMIELPCFVEGISHEADAAGVWETTFHLSGARDDVFFTTPFILDTSVLDGADLIGF